MKMFKNILLSLVFSVSLFACWQDPGPLGGIVTIDLSEGFNSIVGMNYYTSRLSFDDNKNIRLDWSNGSINYWILITSQTTYSNRLNSGLPITLYFNIMSKEFKDKLLEIADSDNKISSTSQLEEIREFLYVNYAKSGSAYGEFLLNSEENDVVKDAYLYYKIVSELTTEAQQNSNWHICGEVHLDETKTNVTFPGNDGATIFGKDNLTLQKIQNDGETISTGDYIIFFMYVVNGDGESNVDQNYRPQIKGNTPILPATCLGESGQGYEIGHIFTVRYDGTEIYHK